MTAPVLPDPGTDWCFGQMTIALPGEAEQLDLFAAPDDDPTPEDPR